MVISGRGPRKIGQHERQHRKARSATTPPAHGLRSKISAARARPIVEIALMPEIECSGHRSVYSVPRAARAGAQAFRHAKGVPQILLSYECRTPRTIRTSTLRVRPTAPPYHKTPVTPTTARTGRACTAFLAPTLASHSSSPEGAGATSHKSNPTIRRPDATTRDNR